MRKTFTILLCLLTFMAFAQQESTKEGTIKVRKQQEESFEEVEVLQEIEFPVAIEQPRVDKPKTKKTIYINSAHDLAGFKLNQKGLLALINRKQNYPADVRKDGYFGTFEVTATSYNNFLNKDGESVFKVRVTENSCANRGNAMSMTNRASGCRTLGNEAVAVVNKALDQLDQTEFTEVSKGIDEYEFVFKINFELN